MEELRSGYRPPVTLELDRTEQPAPIADGVATLCLLVDDHEIIVHGLRTMLSPYREVTVQSFSSWAAAEIKFVEPALTCANGARVALTDPFSKPTPPDGRTADLRDVTDRVVFFTFDTSSAQRLCSLGRADAVIAKSCSSAEILAGLERVVRQEPFDRSRRTGPDDCDLAALSDRECEVLDLLARGFTNQQIADVMFLSIDTIKTYLRRVYAKLGVENRTQAALLAVGATP